MSELVTDLKREHAQIAEVLENVKNLGVNSKEGQEQLLTAMNGLLAHLKKEDEQLYPALNEAAEIDSNLKRTLDVFAQDMAEISKAAMDFFEKYSGGGSGLEFAQDFGRLAASLTQRIRKEENILYAKYDSLAA